MSQNYEQWPNNFNDAGNSNNTDDEIIFSIGPLGGNYRGYAMAERGKSHIELGEMSRRRTWWSKIFNSYSDEILAYCYCSNKDTNPCSFVFNMGHEIIPREIKSVVIDKIITVSKCQLRFMVVDSNGRITNLIHDVVKCLMPTYAEGILIKLRKFLGGSAQKMVRLLTLPDSRYDEGYKKAGIKCGSLFILEQLIKNSNKNSNNRKREYARCYSRILDMINGFFEQSELEQCIAGQIQMGYVRENTINILQHDKKVLGEELEDIREELEEAKEELAETREKLTRAWVEITKNKVESGIKGKGQTGSSNTSVMSDEKYDHESSKRKFDEFIGDVDDILEDCELQIVSLSQSPETKVEELVETVADARELIQIKKRKLERVKS